MELSLSNNGAERKYRGYSSPLIYYLAHPELHSLGRTGLGRKRREGGDPGLLRSLYRWEQTDLAIPTTGYRGYSSPLAYYTDHPKLHNLSRTELGKPENDPGLLKALYRWEQMDLAIPEKIIGYQKGHAGRHLPPGAREEIMRAHGRFSSFRSAEKRLPACRKTIAKIWARMDLEKIQS